MYGAKGSWKKECIVIPPALIAAIPVGARIIILLGDSFTSVLRNVVLPVPAFPVRNMFVPVCAISVLASSSSGFVFMCYSL